MNTDIFIAEAEKSTVNPDSFVCKVKLRDISYNTVNTNCNRLGDASELRNEDSG